MAAYLVVTPTVMTNHAGKRFGGFRGIYGNFAR